MRTSAAENGITLRAIAGTHVVLLAWSLSEQDSEGVLGFAVHRTDHTEGEAYWLKGLKVFEETDPGRARASLRSHPVQGFTWSDFTAKRGHEYSYRVVAMRGTPTDLHQEEQVAVRVRTEAEDIGAHEVWFNRGAVASQEYTRRFANRPPSEVGAPAYRWLSRGLFEALMGFIGQARSGECGLRVAAYQFSFGPVLQALSDAQRRGADVRILYDARQPEVAVPNREAVEALGILGLCTERTANPSAIAHNKFIVLLRDHQPVAVWTGSTNFTEGGIYGHSNVGHVVRDGGVAQRYLQYWELLNGNPVLKTLRPRVEDLTPTPGPSTAPESGTTALFSPRSGTELLDWYAGRVASATSLLCMTFAFGMNKTFVPAFQTPFAGLRYGLFDSAGTREDAKATVLALRKQPFNRFAIGNFIKHNNFDRWLSERLSGLNRHARFIHTKYLLVDPLSNDPVVVTGSANFSQASTTDNDENMLIVRGDQTVADIYLTEYFRLWNHYAFREWAATAPIDARPQFLKPDDSWRSPYYGNTPQSRQRRLFSGADS